MTEKVAQGFTLFEKLTIFLGILSVRVLRDLIINNNIAIKDKKL
jgi:hypothetical protein